MSHRNHRWSGLGIETAGVTAFKESKVLTGGEKVTVFETGICAQFSAGIETLTSEPHRVWQVWARHLL